MSLNYIKKFRRLSTSLQIIIIILSLVGLWMLSGIFSSKHQVDSQEIAKASPSVKIIESHAQSKNISIKVNGVTQAYQSVNIKPELDGLVTKVLAKDGQYLKKGEVIVFLDEKNRKAELEKARSEFEKQQIQLTSVKKLYDKGLSSENALLEAKTNLKAAQSGFEQAKINYEKTRIIAPFDGYIEDITVNVGDYVSTFNNSVIAIFSSLNPIKVNGSLSASQATNIAVNDKIKAMNSSNAEFSGEVSFIAKVADPSTRTFKVETIVNNESEGLKIGESVSLEISGNQEKTMHHLPKSAIILDKDGKISVKILEGKNVIKTRSIQILDEDQEGFWISGLGELAKVVTYGGAYVKDGDEVTVK